MREQFSGGVADDAVAVLDVTDAGDAIARRGLASGHADPAFPLPGQRTRRIRPGDAHRAQDIARPQRHGRSARIPSNARNPLQAAARRRFRTAEPPPVFRRGSPIHR